MAVGTGIRLKVWKRYPIIALFKRNRAREIDDILDAFFIKAWSIRHPRNG